MTGLGVVMLLNTLLDGSGSWFPILVGTTLMLGGYLVWLGARTSDQR